MHNNKMSGMKYTHPCLPYPLYATKANLCSNKKQCKNTYEQGLILNGMF